MYHIKVHYAICAESYSDNCKTCAEGIPQQLKFKRDRMCHVLWKQSLKRVTVVFITCGERSEGHTRNLHCS
jgi:hypothetical protein